MFISIHEDSNETMAGSTFKAYMENLQIETGKTAEDIWRLANKKGFVKRNKIVAKHANLLAWLKSDIGLGHVRANFVILYLRVRTNDANLSTQSRDWAYNTGYKDYKK
jgi:hypothetical protein